MLVRATFPEELDDDGKLNLKNMAPSVHRRTAVQRIPAMVGGEAGSSSSSRPGTPSSRARTAEGTENAREEADENLMLT